MLKGHPPRLVKDWSPIMIGTAVPRKMPAATYDSHRLQLALLGKPKPCLMTPRPVPILDSLEKLVTFLNR